MNKLKKIPVFKTDKEAENFVDNADLSEYDLSGFKPVKFILEDEEKTINITLSKTLFNSIKNEAEIKGLDYQKYIKNVIENSLNLVK